MARISNGEDIILTLGNIDASRDWGFAGDYVEGMWMMLQEEAGADYILASGETHTVRQFVEVAAEVLGMKIEWHGTGVDERGVDSVSGKEIVRISTEFYRPAEVDVLLGDPKNAKESLGWEPKVSFDELVVTMVEADVRRVRERPNNEPIQRF